MGNLKESIETKKNEQFLQIGLLSNELAISPGGGGVDFGKAISKYAVIERTFLDATPQAPFTGKGLKVFTFPFPDVDFL